MDGPTMLLILTLIATMSHAITSSGQAQTKPKLVPFFSAVDDGPSFLIECRNDTEQTISSGADVWPFARAVRIDGKVVEESGGRIGPGLTVQVYPGDTWRGILTLRQSERGESPPVSFGAMVRSGRRFPLSSGRHTIAVQCGPEWSSDVAFYWEAEEQDDQ
jgi:hypothetical protein